MEKPHFEITYVPKDSKVIPKLRNKLDNPEELEREVHGILSRSNIKPTKVYIKMEEVGKGRKDTWLEGFKYIRFHGKVRGKQKRLLKDKKWKSDFDIYLLEGDVRDGLLFQATVEDGKEVKAIGQSIYNRLVESLAKQGPVQWNEVVRTGTI